VGTSVQEEEPGSRALRSRSGSLQIDFDALQISSRREGIVFEPLGTVFDELRSTFERL
jgi:hypothetical protein